MIRLLVRLAKAYAIYRLGKLVVRENGKRPQAARSRR